MFFFLKVFVSVGPVLMSAGRWQKFTFGQIRDESRTSTKVPKLSKRGFCGFGLYLHYANFYIVTLIKGRRRACL